MKSRIPLFVYIMPFFLSIKSIYATTRFDWTNQVRANDDTSVESLGQISTALTKQTALTFSSGIEYRRKIHPAETRAALTQFFSTGSVDDDSNEPYLGDPFYFQFGLSAPVSKYFSKNELGSIDFQLEKTIRPFDYSRSLSISLNPVFKSWLSSLGPRFHHFSVAMNFGIGFQTKNLQKSGFSIENTFGYETQLFFDHFSPTETNSADSGIWVFWPIFHDQLQLTLECSKEISLFLLGRLSTDTRQSIDKREVTLGMILHFE